jgi:uncharacterized BrkB/YihY/UPF0761 family membrane protein
MPRFLKPSYALGKQAASEWMTQNMSRYTLFAIAPLFVIVLAIAGLWFGALITALFFNLGKLLFTPAYGAVGSLVGVLLSVYFSAQILFFGVKFTQIYSNRYGSRLELVPGAKAVTLAEVVAETPHPVG